jgi:3-phenylpropionate/trans-cinnamate dioxygenase ferredoxin reductase subunit
MNSKVNACINGRSFTAKAGEVLLDAAIRNGINVPYDCRIGHCGVCCVQIVGGRILGGETDTEGAVHACQARLLSDVDLAFDAPAEVDRVRAIVTAVNDIAEGVIELVMRPERPLSALPGQHVEVAFAGFPARALFPTAPLDAQQRSEEAHFHVRQRSGGAVSSKLGSDVTAGHAATITGPFGSSYLRSGNRRRLVLIASGTGFAAIWAIADAALREWPGRPMVVVTGAGALERLYMAPALQLLSQCPNVALTMSTREPQKFAPIVKLGPVESHLPQFRTDDIVHVAGSARLVAAVTMAATAAGAEVHASVIEAAPPPRASVLDRLGEKLSTVRFGRRFTRDEAKPQPVPLRLELDPSDIRA